jgi:phage portal protein BeeE
VLARLAEFPLPPSIIIESSGGLHLHWLLREPFDVQADEVLIRDVLGRLAAHFGGDRSVAQPAAILRVPQTLNFKYEPPRRVVMASSEPSRRYNPSDLLEEGAKYERLGIPPDDAQSLSTRTWQVVDIARWFNMPSSLLSAVHEGSSLTYRNVSEESQRFVDWCLLAWAKSWEQELGRKLLSPRERETLYFEHDFNGLLKGDLPTRYSAYATGSRTGGCP